MKRTVVLLLLFFVSFLFPGCKTQPDEITSNAFFTPADFSLKTIETIQPLKGFVSWGANDDSGIPCSIEYLPVNVDTVLTGENTCNWTVFETVLNDCAARKHQALVRFVIDNVDGTLCLPQNILDRITLFDYPYENETYQSPDYNDEYFIEQIKYFIHDFGRIYNGDPRIAFIQSGILGHWGEQHVFFCPDGEFDASTFQTFFEAFANAFTNTCIGSRRPDFAGVKENNIGLYNDMIISDADDSYFRGLLADPSSNPGSWKQSAVTGEIAPGLQISFIEDIPNGALYSKYLSRIKEFHVSCALNAAIFDENPTASVRKKYIKASNQMGYSLRVVSAAVCRESDINLKCSVKIKNEGIAPFYYSWPVSLALYKNSQISAEYHTGWDISSILPGQSTTFEYQINSESPLTAEGACKLLLKVTNPLENGYPFAFANKTQDSDVETWVTLGVLLL